MNVLNGDTNGYERADADIAGFRTVTLRMASRNSRAPAVALYRIMLRAGLDRDPPQFRELGDAGLAAESAVARGLGAAERHVRLVVHRRAVDVADAGLAPPGDVERAGDVAAEHGRRQPILGVVGDAHRLVDAVDPHDADDRATSP